MVGFKRATLFETYNKIMGHGSVYTFIELADIFIKRPDRDSQLPPRHKDDMIPMFEWEEFVNSIFSGNVHALRILFSEIVTERGYHGLMTDREFQNLRKLANEHIHIGLYRSTINYCRRVVKMTDWTDPDMARIHDVVQCLEFATKAINGMEMAEALKASCDMKKVTKKILKKKFHDFKKLRSDFALPDRQTAKDLKRRLTVMMRLKVLETQVPVDIDRILVDIYD